MRVAEPIFDQKWVKTRQICMLTIWKSSMWKSMGVMGVELRQGVVAPTTPCHCLCMKLRSILGTYYIAL